MEEQKKILVVGRDNELLKECLGVRRAVFQIEKGIPEEVDIDAYDCINDACEHFLIQYDKKSVGTVRCRVNFEGREIRLQRFCILSDYRRLGLGRFLLEFLDDYYGNKGFEIIRLDSKFSVQGFYGKCGYRVVSEVFIEAGVEHVRMEKSLN